MTLVVQNTLDPTLYNSLATLTGSQGVFIIKYLGAQRGTGGTSITSVNGYTYHTFTTAGTYTG
jgi:hypothetical protein